MYSLNQVLHSKIIQLKNYNNNHLKIPVVIVIPIIVKLILPHHHHLAHQILTPIQVVIVAVVNLHRVNPIKIPLFSNNKIRKVQNLKNRVTHNLIVS